MAAGLGLLLATAYQIWDPGAAREQHSLAADLERQWHRHPAARHWYQPVMPVPGQPFAFLRIPRFGPNWRFAVIEGTSPDRLTSGPGHVPDTQLPGQRGNFAVAAHDLTAGNPFLRLATLRHGDRVYVTTVNGTYTYRVLSESVVRYTDVGALDPVPGHPGVQAKRKLITLISCTPVTLAFTPWRVIVTGALVSSPG